MDFETRNSNNFFPKKRRPDSKAIPPKVQQITEFSPEAFSPHKSIIEKLKHLEIQEANFKDIMAGTKRDCEAIEILLIITLYAGKAPYFRMKYLELLEDLLPYLPRTEGEVKMYIKSMRFDREYEGVQSRSLAAKALSQLVDGNKLVSIITPILTQEWESPDLRMDLIELVSSIQDPRIGIALGGIFTSKRLTSRLRQKAMWGLVKEHEYHRHQHPAVFEALKAIIRDDREESLIRSTCADVLGLMKELFPSQQLVHSAIYDNDFVFNATINAVKKLQTESNVLSVLEAIDEIHRLFSNPAGKIANRLDQLQQSIMKYDLLGLLMGNFRAKNPTTWQPHLVQIIRRQGAINLSKLIFLAETNQEASISQTLKEIIGQIQPFIQKEEKIKILL